MPLNVTYFHHPQTADGVLTASGAHYIASTYGINYALFERNDNIDHSTFFACTLSLRTTAFERFDFGLVSAALSQSQRLHRATLRLYHDAAAIVAPVDQIASGVVAVLARDDTRWSRVTSGQTMDFTRVASGQSAAFFDLRNVLTVSGGGSITTTAGGDGTLFNVKTQSAGSAIAQFGQSILYNIANAPLSGISFRVTYNAPGPGGNARVRVYQSSSNSGFDDVPNGAALAVSDDLAFPVAGALQTMSFLFTGANQITLVSGTRYIFMFESDYAHGAAQAIQARVRGVATDAYTNGGTIVGTPTKYAFHQGVYATEMELPHIYDGGAGATVTAPFGSITPFTIAPTVVSGTITEIDVTQIVQEWIDSISFVPNVIGLILTPSNPLPVGSFSHSWNESELVISAVVNQAVSGAVSGVVGVTPGLSLQNGLGGQTPSGTVSLSVPLSLQNGFAGAVSGVVSGAGSAIVKYNFGAIVSGVVNAVGSTLAMKRSFAATVSGVVTIGRASLTSCGWFLDRAVDWFNARTNDWFTRRDC